MNPYTFELVLVFLSFAGPLSVLAQTCVATDCTGFISTVEVCSSANPSITITPLAFLSCLCRQPSQFENDVQSCYTCDETLGNQTLLNQLGEVLNLCGYVSSSNATPTVTSITTLSILDRTSRSSPSVPSSTIRVISIAACLCPSHLSLVAAGLGILYLLVLSRS